MEFLFVVILLVSMLLIIISFLYVTISSIISSILHDYFSKFYLAIRLFLGVGILKDLFALFLDSDMSE